MPTRIPIYKAEIFEKLDKDKEEIKREMNDLALLILAKLESCVCEPKEVKKPLPITKKK